jgi:hypothetical protein
MAEYATIKDVERIVGKAVDDLSEVISSLAQNMHNEIAEVKTELAVQRSSIDRLTNTIDGFLKRLDEVESEQTARRCPVSAVGGVGKGSF